MENNAYAVYLVATSNEILNEKLENGKVVDGMLEINYDDGEMVFTGDDRIALRYNEVSIEADGFYFTDGTSYYRFANEAPNVIKAVKNNG